jgi:hypothetical protein
MNRISMRDKAAQQQPIITPPKMSRDKYDQSQLSKGIEVEKEHTTDENLAANIAMNHLDESKDYYTKLQQMESGF